MTGPEAPAMNDGGARHHSQSTLITAHKGDVLDNIRKALLLNFCGQFQCLGTVWVNSEIWTMGANLMTFEAPKKKKKSLENFGGAPADRSCGLLANAASFLPDTSAGWRVDVW